MTILPLFIDIYVSFLYLKIKVHVLEGGKFLINFCMHTIIKRISM